MKTISEIKTGFLEVLKLINTGSGFNNTLPSTHVRGFYDGAWIDDKRDTEYPKVLVVIDSADRVMLPAYQTHRVIHFLVFVYVKQLQVDYSPVSVTETFIEDVEKAIIEHSSLNGTVDEAKVVSFMTDGGVLAPEGCAIITVEALAT